jgi:hypothetical protein
MSCCGEPALGFRASVQNPRMARFVNFVKNVRDDERGDVPGWVLITLMTAGLVLLVWALAGPALQGVFQQAIDRVTGF